MYVYVCSSCPPERFKSVRAHASILQRADPSVPIEVLSIILVVRLLVGTDMKKLCLAHRRRHGRACKVSGIHDYLMDA